MEKVENRAAVSNREESMSSSSSSSSAVQNGVGAGTKSAVIVFGHCSRLYS
jgi:hypothetical protein